MSYVYREAEKLVGEKVVGSGQCVELVRQGLNGIFIVDQWHSKDKTKIGRRFIPSKGKNRDGTFKDPSNNADAFSVIER